MKNAWTILKRGYAFDFRSALKRAWNNAKSLIKSRAQEIVRKEIRSRATAISQPDLSGYYNRPSGSYYGD